MMAEASRLEEFSKACSCSDVFLDRPLVESGEPGDHRVEVRNISTLSLDLPFVVHVDVRNGHLKDLLCPPRHSYSPFF